jgi:type I restriction enzyme S subunit
MYLSSKNFKPHGLDLSKVEFISETDYQRHFKEHSKAITKPMLGDVLVGIIGSLGEPYVIRESDRFGLSSSVAILRPNKNLLLPKYLYYWMRGAKFQSAVYGIKGGVAQSYLSLEMIRSLPVELPILAVQRRIVDILSVYDDLIENNTLRIKTSGANGAVAVPGMVRQFSLFRPREVQDGGIKDRGHTPFVVSRCALLNSR